MKLKLPKITVWRVILAVVLLVALTPPTCAYPVRLGGATNLSDQFPWGLWIGFDVLCGVGLASGGFTLVALVHIFNIKTYRQRFSGQAISRRSSATSWSRSGLLPDLGQRGLWHPLVMWNPHSVMFEVAWSGTLYSTVLSSGIPSGRI